MEFHIHAHPMLTPLLPLRSPEAVGKEYPPDTAAVYNLIWDNTLGHLRSPQKVTEGIHCYISDKVTVGLRWLAADDNSVTALLPELDSYRVTKHRIPAGGFSEIGTGDLHIESVEPSFEPAPGCDTDTAALLLWLDTLQIVSPGRLGTILDELVSAGWIEMVGTQYRLTTEGGMQLHLQSDAGLGRISGVTSARWRELISSYFATTMSLEELLAESNRIFDTDVSILVSAIDDIVTGEHTAKEAYALRDNVALKESSAVSFPTGMDPERLLPMDDPLRTQRNQLESRLSEGRAHQWLCLSNMEKASIRMGAILSQQYKEDAERQQFCASVKFDVRARWMVGIGADASTPSHETAQRAYEAWAQA